MIKIILDTNVFVSALLYGGMSHKILKLITDDKLQLLVSKELFKEVIGKFKDQEASEEQIENVTKFLLKKGIFVVPTVEVTISRDPEDNYLLELAEASKADYIITRDKDLLELPNKKWKNTKIVKPERLLSYLRAKKILR